MHLLVHGLHTHCIILLYYSCCLIINTLIKRLSPFQKKNNFGLTFIQIALLDFVRLKLCLFISTWTRFCKTSYAFGTRSLPSHPSFGRFAIFLDLQLLDLFVLVFVCYLKLYGLFFRTFCLCSFYFPFVFACPFRISCFGVGPLCSFFLVVFSFVSLYFKL